MPTDRWLALSCFLKTGVISMNAYNDHLGSFKSFRLWLKAGYQKGYLYYYKAVLKHFKKFTGKDLCWTDSIFNAQNALENTCANFSFWKGCRPTTYHFITKTPALLLSLNFAKFMKITFLKTLPGSFF